MAYYLVHYSLGVNNEYVYPNNVAGVVWKSTVYHYTDQVMVGETDETVKADGKNVITLTPTEFGEHTKRLQSSFPQLQDVLAPLRPSHK